MLPLRRHTNGTAVIINAFVGVTMRFSCAGAFFARIVPPFVVNLLYRDCNQELLFLQDMEARHG